MKTILSSILYRAALVAAAIALAGAPMAVMAQSGQTAQGQTLTEAAFDDTTGNVIYLLTPNKAPFPANANQQAVAPLYMVVYPTSSTIDANTLNCQPSNCSHLEVLPFPNSDYGALPGTNQACIDFNGSQPCSQVKGHDHLVGIANTGGDFNVDWQLELVIFMHKAFLDGSVNQRVRTLAQIQSLLNNGEAFLAIPGINFNCSKVSEATYYQGTPMHVVYP